MPQEQTVTIGQSIKRIDALSKVTGEAPYPGDIDMDGQLWLKIRFSDRAHARVLAIDTQAAETLAGVHAVFTAKDIPVNEYGLVTKDQPVLCGPGSAMPGADVVRCYADMVAVVVADTEAIATEAAALIDITYEDLPLVTDPELAMQDGKPQLHAKSTNNILCHYRIRHGDMAAGWEQAEVVVEGEYHTGWQEHAYLQPEAGLGYIDEEGRVTVIVAGQWTHEDQEQIYHALNLPPEQVRVIYPAIGGAFGGREDMSVQIVLALAAHRLGRPIKTVWSREESIQYHHKRHPVTVRTRWGATINGMVVAAEATVIGDAGAYNYTSTKVLGNAQLTVTGPYVIPNCHVDTYGVYTNNIPCGAFRGFGAPQGLFAAEGQMNKLAAALENGPAGSADEEHHARGQRHLRWGLPCQPGYLCPKCGKPVADKVTGSRIQMVSGRGSQPNRTKHGPGCAGVSASRAGFKNIGFSFGFPEQSWATVELRGGGEIEEVDRSPGRGRGRPGRTYRPFSR